MKLKTNYAKLLLVAAVGIGCATTVAQKPAQQRFDSLWGSDAASAALQVLESAYTAASCPDPADYFQDAQCLNWFCGVFGVCSGSYEETTSADLELICDSSSSLGKKCANDLFLLEEVAKIKGSACSDVVSLAKYTCTKDTIASSYCGLDRYLGVADACSSTSSCCEFVFDNATDITERCCSEDEYEGTTCLQTENLRYQCTNGFLTAVSGLGTNGPTLIREFCPALFDYDTKSVLGYDKWESGCEEAVSSFFAGIFQLLGDEEVDASALVACTSCAKDLKAVERLAESYLETDPSCAIISQGIARGCAYDSYQADLCIEYVPFLFATECDDTKFSCCQDQVSYLFDTYANAFGTDLAPVLEEWYTVESYSVVCEPVPSFFLKTDELSSVCTALVDVTESSVEFCPQLYNGTSGTFTNLAGVSVECATEISQVLQNLRSGELAGTSLCRACEDDLATLEQLVTAAAVSDETCSVISVVAEWLCLQDFELSPAGEYFCSDFNLISDSDDCSSSYSACCQDKLDSLLDSAVAEFTDAQKSAVDDVLFVQPISVVCPSATIVSSETCFTAPTAAPTAAPTNAPTTATPASSGVSAPGSVMMPVILFICCIMLFF